MQNASLFVTFQQLKSKVIEIMQTGPTHFRMMF
jgi:hypothetical protein